MFAMPFGSTAQRCSLHSPYGGSVMALRRHALCAALPPRKPHLLDKDSHIWYNVQDIIILYAKGVPSCP